jgi:ribosomal protein S18 acetylase RimI-like enzyme
MIRKCTIEDMPAIYELVVELAVFEKEPEAVVSNISEYEKCYTDKLIDCFVAEMDGKVVGMALYYYVFSTWKGRSLYLEDFVVKADYRSHGIGQQLFDAIVDQAKKSGCRDMRWQVLDWNEQAIKFYEKNNSTFLKNWWNGRINFK